MKATARATAESAADPAAGWADFKTCGPKPDDPLNAAAWPDTGPQLARDPFALAPWHLLDRLVGPVLAASQAVPGFVLAPVLTIRPGHGKGPKAALVVLLVFFPVPGAVGAARGPTSPASPGRSAGERCCSCTCDGRGPGWRPAWRWPRPVRRPGR